MTCSVESGIKSVSLSQIKIQHDNNLPAACLIPELLPVSSLNDYGDVQQHRITCLEVYQVVTAKPRGSLGSTSDISASPPNVASDNPYTVYGPAVKLSPGDDFAPPLLRLAWVTDQGEATCKSRVDKFINVFRARAATTRSSAVLQSSRGLNSNVYGSPEWTSCGKSSPLRSHVQLYNFVFHGMSPEGQYRRVVRANVWSQTFSLGFPSGLPY